MPSLMMPSCEPRVCKKSARHEVKGAISLVNVDEKGREGQCEQDVLQVVQSPRSPKRTEPLTRDEGNYRTIPLTSSVEAQRHPSEILAIKPRGFC